jgi:hypothetical protein
VPSLSLSADSGINHTIGQHKFNATKSTGPKGRKPAACIASRKRQLGYLDFPNAAGSDLVVLTRMHVSLAINKWKVFRMASPTRRNVTRADSDMIFVECRIARIAQIMISLNKPIIVSNHSPTAMEMHLHHSGIWAL